MFLVALCNAAASHLSGLSNASLSSSLEVSADDVSPTEDVHSDLDLTVQHLRTSLMAVFSLQSPSHPPPLPSQTHSAVPVVPEEDEDVVLPPMLDNIQYIPPHASKSPGMSVSYNCMSSSPECVLISCSCTDASAVLEVNLKKFWKLFLAESKFYSEVHLAKGDRGTSCAPPLQQKNPSVAPPT